MADPRRIISLKEKSRLVKAGFTVTATAITGGTDGLLAKLVKGGRWTLRRLKMMGTRA